MPQALPLSLHIARVTTKSLVVRPVHRAVGILTTFSYWQAHKPVMVAFSCTEKNLIKLVLLLTDLVWKHLVDSRVRTQIQHLSDVVDSTTSE